MTQPGVQRGNPPAPAPYLMAVESHVCPFVPGLLHGAQRFQGSSWWQEVAGFPPFYGRALPAARVDHSRLLRPAASQPRGCFPLFAPVKNTAASIGVQTPVRTPAPHSCVSILQLGLELPMTAILCSLFSTMLLRCDVSENRYF